MSMMEYYEREQEQEQERQRWELQWPKENPLLHRRFNGDLKMRVDHAPDDSIVYTVTQKLVAEVVDRTDEVLIQAIIAEAERSGVSDLYLIDRQFVLEALQLKREVVRCKDCTSYGEAGRCRDCNLWRDPDDFCSRGKKKEAET